MNIWFDTTLLSQGATHAHKNGYEATSDCDCDCDCPESDCGLSETGSDTTSFITAPPEVAFQHLSMHTWQLTGELYRQTCGASLYFVCDPVGSGTIAVLDAEAYALLERFRTPMSLQEILCDSTATPEALMRALALFVDLGLLRATDSAPPSYKIGESHTLSIWLHVTNACNLRCSYCYIAKTSEHMADDVSMRAVDAVIRSATRNHYRSISLKYAGGESTLRLPQIFAVHDYALEQARRHGLGLAGTILTNGIVMPQHIIEQIKRRRIRITISLDGIGAHHDRQRPLLNGKGSFAFVDRTISRLLANHWSPGINVTVTQHNLAELPALMDYLLQRDLHFRLSYYRDNDCSLDPANLQFTDAHMIEGMRAAFARIEAQLPRRRLVDSLIDKGSMSGPHQHVCSMGRDYLVIDQRGGVAKCQADIAQTVTTIHADDPLRVLRGHQQGVQQISVDEKEGCRDCSWRYWCRGGCPLLTYRLTGRNDVKSPNCAIYKALFPKALRLEALRLLTYESPMTL